MNLQSEILFLPIGSQSVSEFAPQVFGYSVGFGGVAVMFLCLCIILLLNQSSE